MRVDNPYKPLFSLGIVSGLLGVMVWPLFTHHWLAFYPKQAHVQIMFFGFFWSFVAGFLFTAIPRMTGTPLASVVDVLIAAVLIAVQNVINYTPYYESSAVVFIGQTLYLLYFIVPRFLEKRKIPFDGFLFFPAAFAMSLLGVVFYQVYGDMRFLIILSGEAFLTNLIIGLGSRLIPAVSRLPNAFMHPGMAVPLRWKTMFVKVFLLNTSFVAEAMGYKDLGNILRLLVVGYIAVDSFGLLKKGTVFSVVALGLKCSVFFMIMSYVARLIPSDHNPVAHSHLLYIGGFSLLTLMIATRVALAHSQTSLDYELKSILVFSVVALVSLSALMRWLANYDISDVWIYLSIAFFTSAYLIWLAKHLTLIRSALVQKEG